MSNQPVEAALQEDYEKDPDAVQDLKLALEKYQGANVTTQFQMGFDHIVSTKKLAHYANTAISALDEAEGEITELKNDNAFLNAENTVYKNKFGPLDEATRQSVANSTQLIPLNSNREHSILRLQKHSKLIQRKEKLLKEKYQY